METIGRKQEQALHRAELAALGRAQRKSTEPGEALPVTAADRREQVQQFLRRYRQAVAQAEDLAGEVQALRLLEDRLGSTLPPSSPALARLERLTAQLEDQLARCLDIRAQVERVIQMVGDEQQQRILQLRYIRGMTWERIGHTLTLDERWVRRLHAKTLDSLARHMPPL